MNFNEIIHFLFNIVLIYLIIWEIYCFINSNFIYGIIKKHQLKYFNKYERISMIGFTLFIIIELFINFKVSILIIALTLIHEFILNTKLSYFIKEQMLRLVFLLNILLLFYLLF